MSGEAEVDEGDEGVGGVEAVAAVADQPDLGVEAFEAAVWRGQRRMVARMPSLWLRKGARDGGQTAAAVGFARPGRRSRRSGRQRGVVEVIEQPKLFSEQEGRDSRTVLAQDVGERGVLVDRLVLGPL